MDAETAALGLRQAVELRVDLPKKRGPAVIRGYDGQDAAGRALHAVRVATPLGVVLAVGPLDLSDADRRTPTELVPALAGSGEAAALRSGSDLNGDGILDVVLRSEDGAIAIWHFDTLGSGAYEVEMAAPPLAAIDVDGDGSLDLQGRARTPAGDPIDPRLTDVATFDHGRYTHASTAARAWHAKAARVAPPGASAPPEARLRAHLEMGWHAALAGQRSVENVLDDLQKQVVPPALRAPYERHLRLFAAALGAR